MARGHFSTAEIRNAWYVACRSKELRSKPLRRVILGTEMVLFRTEDGTPAALLDRCAHRNVPLSLGLCQDDRLICGYHGWEFDREGICQRVPALAGVQTGRARRVPAYPTVEQQGYVWVQPSAEDEPATEPYAFPHLHDPQYATVRYDAELEATLHATLENILDVPHTAFLHRGLFRGTTKNEITAVVRRFADRVEAEFIGEPRPEGIIGRILAPRGGTVEHFDRFLLPSIAQVEYRLGEGNHVIATSALTPVSDFVTKLYAVVTFRTVLPAFLLRPVVTPIGMRILKQDIHMLKQQTDTIRRFGGEQYVSTDVDLLGPHILRLLRQAERGDQPTSDEPTQEEIKLIA